MVLFPEGFLSGYAKEQIADWDDVDWPAVREELDQVAGLAAEFGMWVVLGSAHALTPPPADTSGRSLAPLVHQGMPYVLVDRLVPSGEACSVSVDDVTGGAMAARHLLDAGHNEIVFINGPMHLAQCRDRYEGVCKAIAEAGLPASTVTTLHVDRLDVAAGRDAAARILGLPRRPTAVFCANDLIALGVLQTIYAAGIRVPDQMAIVGYDDIEFAAAAAVPLTSVRQPAFQIGTTATELLIDETDGLTETHEHQRVVFQPELVVRRSSLPAR
jgi:LacI family transcriptional regulator